MQKHKEIKRDYVKELARRNSWFRDGSFKKWMDDGKRKKDLPVFLANEDPETVRERLCEISTLAYSDWEDGDCAESEMDPKVAIATQDAAILFCISNEFCTKPRNAAVEEDLVYVAFLAIGATSQFLIRFKKIASLYVGNAIASDQLEQGLVVARGFFKERFACKVEDFLVFERLIGAIYTRQLWGIERALDLEL